MSHRVLLVITVVVLLFAGWLVKWLIDGFRVYQFIPHHTRSATLARCRLWLRTRYYRLNPEVNGLEQK